MIEADPGSFRDPTSRVLLDGDEVLRGLSTDGLADFEATAATEFFGAAMDAGEVVRTELLAPGSHPLHEHWAGVLRHERIPMVSYPSEWSFEMLRDAALAHLDLSRRAIAAGLSTKDASSFNVTFDGTRPVFLDVGSFEVPRRAEAWAGYRQFGDHFLDPLVLQAQGGAAFHPWLRGTVNGISPADVASLVPLRRRLRKGLAVHVTAAARTERKALAAPEGADLQGRRAGFSPKLVTAQLDSLERTVRALRWKAQRSVWSDYSDRSHYGSELPAKERFVREAVAATGPKLVLDLGANDGHFSLLAVEAGAPRAIAADVDHLVVDRLYRHLRDTGEQRILPLVVDLMNPAGSSGWRSVERRPFLERARPDLVLCLAVVHHLAITDNVPFAEIVEMLAGFGCPVVVELPGPDDPKVQVLLARKRPGLFDHYRRDTWEAAVGARFEVTATEDLATRTLYRLVPRIA